MYPSQAVSKIKCTWSRRKFVTVIGPSGVQFSGGIKSDEHTGRPISNCEHDYSLNST